MRLRNAYAVYIDFDGDISSDTPGFYIFAGEEARDEVKTLVCQALKDMNDHSVERHGYNSCITDFYGNSIEVPVVLKNDKLINDFIDFGGSHFGNWCIEVMRTED